MLFYKPETTNPYFNIATEEYFLREKDQDFFFLWRNEPSIIVGKHQNTLAEINLDFVRNNNIDVIRRLSGGGTVFHDLGNLNFTFIKNVEEGKPLVDFKSHTRPIVDLLCELGLNAEFSGRNDILVDGKKVSGNAEHVFKKRVIHHGTLLYSSQLDQLSNSLKVIPEKYEDKGVKSVRSKVANIAESLDERMDIFQFRDLIFRKMGGLNEDVAFYDLSEKDRNEIHELVRNKYSTWEWNYGYSPKYTLERNINVDDVEVEFSIKVEKGIIKESRFKSGTENSKLLNSFSTILEGTKHTIDDIQLKIESSSFLNAVEKDLLKELLPYLF